MIYNYIIIDSSNLFWRSGQNIKKMITYTDEALQYLDQSGCFYILFDTFGGMDITRTTFTYNNWRKKLVPSYKEKRIKSKNFLKVLPLYKKYYTYRGENIKLLYAENMEADDFVFPLIETLVEKAPVSIAIHSTDEDLAGFISNKSFCTCHLINDCWNNPMNEGAFFKKYKFLPTYTGIVLYKSFFGDTSDKITGCLEIKKITYNMPIKKYILNWLIEIGKTNIPIETVVMNIKKYKKSTTIENLTPFELVMFHLKILDQKVPIIETLLNNIKCTSTCIKSNELNQYVHSNPERPETNKIFYQSIFGESPISSFGKV